MENTTATTTQCEVSTNLVGPGLRGKVGRCPSKATTIRTIATLLGDDISGHVCNRHAKIIDTGRTLYRRD